MRSMTSIESFRCAGIYLKRATDGDGYALRVNDKVLATVSARDFQEMMRRGHAVIETPLYQGALGGAKLLRCDYRVEEGRPIRLIPDDTTSDEVLLYYMSDNMTCEAADGARLITVA